MLSSNLDLKWLSDKISSETSIYLPEPSNYNPRLEAHITTDKVIYRPNDVIFIEAYIVDAFNKTPIGLNSTDKFFINLYYSIEIYDPTDSQIFSSNTQAENSTVSFTFKIPSEAAGGEYLIKLYNYNTPCVKKLFRVRNYDRD